MARRLFTIVLLLISFLSTAQKKPVCQWARVDTAINIQINPGYIRNAVGASADKVLWARLVTRKTTFNQAGAGDNEVVIYDTAGTRLQSFVVQGRLYFDQVMADAAGNWYLGGRYSDTVIFPGKPVYVRPSTNASDKFICRLNGSSLNVDWFTVVGPSYQTSELQFTMSNGKIYTWGDSVLSNIVYSIDLTTGQPTAIVKQQRAGYLSSIAADNAGNIYLAGSCPSQGAVYFGDHVDTVKKSYEVYVVRYTANGQFDWVSKMNDFTCTARNLTLGDNNTIYYTGTVNDSLTIGGYKFQKPRVFGGNILVACYDSNGVVKWAHQPTDSAGFAKINFNLNAIAMDSSVLVLPLVSNRVDWDNTLKTTATKNFSWATLVDFTRQGNAAWETHTTSLSITPMNMATNGRDIWISGIVRDSAAFKMDGVSEPINMLESTPFVAKLRMPVSSQPIDTTDTTTSVMIPDEQAFTIYPNPATKQLVVEWKTGYEHSAQLTILNTSGVVVYRRMLSNSRIAQTIDVSAFNRGIYFVELLSDKERIIKKVLLQ